MNRIAVVRGAPSAAIQELFRTLVARWRPAARIAGVVAEEHGLPDRTCRAGYLRSIVSGARYSIFQDPGPGAEGCHVEAEGALFASLAVEHDILDGCDLAVLSKFGKLEAAREGLAGAFHVALTAKVPLLTSVSPALERAWTEFPAPRFDVLPAEIGSIETWWRGVRHETAH
ncbi:MAG TPA: DUF2478 domain-containing protein [Alphaproteobacteria bacterium]|nr:DUF2478 domain-containing protein [Alphaproteobacteria bacterium]